jgi:hypothetical protein
MATRLYAKSEILGLSICGIPRSFPKRLAAYGSEKKKAALGESSAAKTAARKTDSEKQSERGSISQARRASVS